MITTTHKNYLPVALGLCVSLAMVGGPDNATADVVVSNDTSIFFRLDKPSGDFDEPSFGGFEYRISGKDLPDFRANDQYLNVGEEVLETNSIAHELGKQPDLAGVAFDFSIVHNKGKHYAFSMVNRNTSFTSIQCWGIECPVGGDLNTSTVALDGQTPITNWNGLQIQVRAQEVNPSSATIENLRLTGVDIAAGSDPLFDGTVTNFTPSSCIPFDPAGRVCQWVLGNDLTQSSWELAGTVTLDRTDDATNDRTKVRLAVDFVNDPTIPPPSAIPVPAALPLFASALALLGAVARRRQNR